MYSHFHSPSVFQFLESKAKSYPSLCALPFMPVSDGLSRQWRQNTLGQKQQEIIHLEF